MQKKTLKKAFVGLSGGVDSAVAAALLKKQGREVTGVYMRLIKSRINRESDEETARRVAKKLGIKFLVWDCRREFKKKVIDYFLSELKAGRTPNPCVVCNPEIKFGLFLEKALKLGVDFVATGHYARLFVIARSETTKQSRANQSNLGIASPRSCGARNDTFQLFAAKDKTKDQSYFLYRLNQRQFSRTLFPLGEYIKKEVYALAKKWRLPYKKEQSFDICFIDDYRKFLEKNIKMKTGKIIKINNVPHPPLKLRGGEPAISAGEGELLGIHQGLPLYTIGQRASIGGPGPFYVVGKDIKKNILYVNNKEKDLYQTEMIIDSVSWASGQAPKLSLKCRVKIRYQSQSVHCLIRANKTMRDNIEVIFNRPQRAITPGQSAVFYGRKGEVLGGGIIA